MSEEMTARELLNTVERIEGHIIKHCEKAKCFGRFCGKCEIAKAFTLIQSLLSDKQKAASTTNADDLGV